MFAYLQSIRLFLITLPADRYTEKEQSVPVTNCFYGLIHIFCGADHSSGVQTIRGVHHFLVSSQSLVYEACFTPPYCVCYVL